MTKFQGIIITILVLALCATVPLPSLKAKDSLAKQLADLSMVLTSKQAGDALDCAEAKHVASFGKDYEMELFINCARVALGQTK